MDAMFDPDDLITNQAVKIIDNFLNHLRKADGITRMQLTAILTRQRRLGYKVQTSFEPDDAIAWLIDDLAVEYTTSGKPATRPADLVANARSFYQLVQLANSLVVRPEIFFGTYVPTIEFAELLLNLFYIQEDAPMLVTPVINPTDDHFIAVTMLDEDGKPFATSRVTIAPLKEFAQNYKVS